MAMRHAHLWLLKRIRWLSRGSWRVRIALGCGIGLASIASAAPPLGVAAPAGPTVGCDHKGVTLQVLGSGGPELQDKRASSSYLVWRAMRTCS